MSKISFVKMIGSATLALTLSLGLVAPAAFAAGPTKVAACTNVKWTGINAKTTEQALMITEVTKSSPAAQAGLAINEILLSINGKTIAQQSDLDQLVASSKVGDKLTLEVARQGGPSYQHSVTLGKNADKPFLGLQTQQVAVEIGPFSYSTDSASNCTAKPFELPYNIARGLFVTQVDANSAMAKAGLAVGDVILQVNGKPAGAPDNLNKLFSAFKSGETLTINIYRPLEKEKLSTLKITLGDKPALGVQTAVIVEGVITTNPVSTLIERIVSGIQGVLRTHHLNKYISFHGHNQHIIRHDLRQLLNRFHPREGLS